MLNPSRNRLDMRMSAIGIQFAVSIAIGMLVGRWLDTRFDTDPWLMLTGTVLGAAAAFIDLFKLSAQIRERDRQEENTSE